MADETVLGNDTSAFDSFVIVTGSRVRRALIACYGVEIGVEAASEAMRVAWEHWPAVAAMDNPAGFLYRAGQSSARPHLRWAQRHKLCAIEDAPREPDRAAVMDLLRGLAKLKPAQRTSVVMVRSYGFSYAEVASVLGISEAAVTNHVHRGLKRLRSILEVTE
jgi:DNA-directed RNA polymerase specialized sigma24 family protein